LLISINNNWLYMFSSRRRHTMCYRDWSSDVCSSDLIYGDGDMFPPEHIEQLVELHDVLRPEHVAVAVDEHHRHSQFLDVRRPVEIGRASCRDGEDCPLDTA